MVGRVRVLQVEPCTINVSCLVGKYNTTTVEEDDTTKRGVKIVAPEMELNEHLIGSFEKQELWVETCSLGGSTVDRPLDCCADHI